MLNPTAAAAAAGVSSCCANEGLGVVLKQCLLLTDMNTTGKELPAKLVGCQRFDYGVGFMDLWIYGFIENQSCVLRTVSRRYTSQSFPHYTAALSPRIDDRTLHCSILVHHTYHSTGKECEWPVLKGHTSLCCNLSSHITPTFRPPDTSSIYIEVKPQRTSRT